MKKNNLLDNLITDYTKSNPVTPDQLIEELLFVLNQSEPDKISDPYLKGYLMTQYPCLYALIYQDDSNIGEDQKSMIAALWTVFDLKRIS